MIDPSMSWMSRSLSRVFLFLLTQFNSFQLCQCHEVEFGSVSDVISSQAHHLNCNNTSVKFHTASMVGELQYLNPGLGGCSPFAPSHSNSDNTAAAIRVTNDNDTDQNNKESQYYHLEAGAIETHDENTAANAKKRDGDAALTARETDDKATTTTDTDDHHTASTVKKINIDNTITAFKIKDSRTEDVAKETYFKDAAQAAKDTDMVHGTPASKDTASSIKKTDVAEPTVNTEAVGNEGDITGGDQSKVIESHPTSHTLREGEGNKYMVY